MAHHLDTARNIITNFHQTQTVGDSSLMMSGNNENINPDTATIHISDLSSPDNGNVSHLGSSQDSNNENGQDETNNSSSRNGSDNENDLLRGFMSQMWKKMYTIIPFVLLFCFKVLHDHSIGLLVLVGLTGTFWHANTILKSCIASRSLHREVILKLLWIVFFLSCSAFILYSFFDDQQLYKGLYCFLPNLSHFDAWNLFWCVLLTDYVLKYITIIIKAIVTLIPKTFISFKKKGPTYLLIEQISQFYRIFPPTSAWFMFLTDDQQSGKAWYNATLVVIYFLLKIYVVYSSAHQLKNAWNRFCFDLSYGVKPSQEELVNLGNSCPICHDNFSEPIKLNCKHVFCEECVALWFDRERTCPMCRTTVVDDPSWRDGATTSLWQIY